MRYLSVCSGIEAATVAFKPLGWQAAAFAEIAPFPCAVLAHHYPEVPNLGDFTKIHPEDVGPIDLLVGGTPCQSFSVAGLRGGLADDRGNLALEFLRLADRTRPRWLLWENVPGVLSSNGGRDFGSILGGMVKLGYGFAYRILDAQYFGLAQRRKRVFVVGYLGDWRPAAAVLFERESLSWNPAPRRQARENLAPTISARTQGGGGLGTDFDCDGGLIAGTLAPGAHPGGFNGRDAESGMLICHALRAEGHDTSEDGTGRGTPIVPVAFALRGRDGGAMPEMEGDCAGALRAASGGSSRSYVAFGGNRTPIVPVAFAIQERAVCENPDAGPDGIGVQADVAYTLEARSRVQAIAFGGNRTSGALEGGDGQLTGALKSGGSKPGQSYPAIAGGTGVRRLTPRECERLMGVPDYCTLVPLPLKGHQTRVRYASDGARYKSLGNSFAVPPVRWIAQGIDDVDTILTAKEAA